MLESQPFIGHIRVYDKIVLPRLNQNKIQLLQLRLYLTTAPFKMICNVAEAPKYTYLMNTAVICGQQNFLRKKRIKQQRNIFATFWSINVTMQVASLTPPPPPACCAFVPGGEPVFSQSHSGGRHVYTYLNFGLIFK